MSAAMSTLTEIEEAVETLPRPEQEVLLRRLSARLRTASAPGRPVNEFAHPALTTRAVMPSPLVTFR